MPTLNFSAQLESMCEGAKKNLKLVVAGSANDVFELATRRQASIKETGTYREGFVPVDTGYLVGSTQFLINGSLKLEGNGASGKASLPPDFARGLIGMELGDTVSMYFTADYAEAVEYGTRYMNGRFYVRNAAMQWETLVDMNAQQFGFAS